MQVSLVIAALSGTASIGTAGLMVFKQATGLSPSGYRDADGLRAD